MIIDNCYITYKDRIEKGCVKVKGTKIEEINPQNIEGEAYIDAKGLYLAPGFIDVHIHGAGGSDTMEGTKEALLNIAKTIVKHGTTAFVPTTMTAPISEVHQALQCIKALKDLETGGAIILGAHLEGPFINPQRIGAQNIQYVRKCSIKDFQIMTADCEEIVSAVTLAPELEGAEKLIKYITSKGITCSAGHTSATYEETIHALEWGVTHTTHLYNAMTSFTHREAGVVGAVFDSGLTTEIIADGIHMGYPALRVAYKQKGTEKCLLITDAMMACCQSTGPYALGGQEVFISHGAARLKDGTLAGSVLTLDTAIRNVYQNTNLPLYEIVKMATYNPAQYCKVSQCKGMIKEGYDADLVLFDHQINIHRVWVQGKEIK